MGEGGGGGRGGGGGNRKINFGKGWSFITCVITSCDQGYVLVHDGSVSESFINGGYRLILICPFADVFN